MKITICAVLLIASACGASAQEARPRRVTVERELMGTRFAIITYANDPDLARSKAKAALEIAADFAKAATDYDPDSELNRMVRAPIHRPYKVSPQLFEALQLSVLLCQQTEGLFDPTIGPLTHLWRQMRKEGRLPSTKDLEEAQKRCGIDGLLLSDEAQTVTILKEGMQLDLGAIGKGFAADLIFDQLKKEGYHSCLVSAGGDLRLGNAPPGKEGWVVAIRAIRAIRDGQTEQKPHSYLLTNCAVSTSGDFYQQISVDGEIYSHLQDPAKGLEVSRQQSASVITSEGKLADPLATAAALTRDPAGLAKMFPTASFFVAQAQKNTPLFANGVFDKKD